MGVEMCGLNTGAVGVGHTTDAVAFVGTKVDEAYFAVAVVQGNGVADAAPLVGLKRGVVDGQILGAICGSAKVGAGVALKITHSTNTNKAREAKRRKVRIWGTADVGTRIVCCLASV